MENQMIAYLILLIYFIVGIFLHILSYKSQSKCSHEWIITGTGYTVCKKCNKIM